MFNDKLNITHICKKRGKVGSRKVFQESVMKLKGYEEKRLKRGQQQQGRVPSFLSSTADLVLQHRGKFLQIISSINPFSCEGYGD